MFIKIFLVLLITIGPQAYSERFCKDSFRDFFVAEPLRFTLEYIKYMMKHGSDSSIKTLREKIQEWGEKTLERNLTEQEVNLLVDIYNIKNAADSLRIAMLHKRDMDLRELGFSKREIQILSEREIKSNLIDGVEIINIPEKTQAEKELEAQGFSAAYRRGIDEVHEWIVMLEQIIKSKADSLKITMLRKRDMDLRELGFSKREIQILSEREIKLSFTKEVEINIPEKTQEEKELEAQGFSAAYRQGIDEVNEWIVVREQIIKSKADPYLTHIDYFAKKMREHINYIEEGITTSSQLRKLNRLKKYAEKLIERRQVTYYLWLRFHLALSTIFEKNNSDDYNSISEYQYGYELINSEITKDFPNNITLPTTIGEMGVIAMNKGGAYNVYPLGLKRSEDSLYFFSHDLEHYFTEQSSMLLYDKLIERMKGLPLEKRKNIELAYFILTHEAGPIEILSSKDHVVPEIKEEIRKFVRTDNEEIRGLINLTHNSDKKVQAVIDDFLEVYLPIQREIETKMHKR